MTMPAMTSESIEMYLKSVCELEIGQSPVAISQLAQRLGVSSPSTIEMVKRLAEQALVTHTPYKGVELTQKGRKRAHNILRRHRLWERFLTDKLGLAWESVHDYACRLEHATAPEVTKALAEFLEHPATCPHGNPIPDAEGKIVQRATTPLCELEVGQTAGLVNVAYEETILLDYLAKRGFFPGSILTVEDIAPYQGPFIIRIQDRTEALGREIASRIFVEIREK
jgi:DtxR family Mn-dependent transcriptional regulator